MAHPAVAEAAVIGDPIGALDGAAHGLRGGQAGRSLTSDEVMAWLRPRVAKWWLPETVEFIDEVPKTSVGKFSKKDLRDQFSDRRVP